MHLRLQTHVNQPLTTVWTGFNRALFDRLSPPFPPVDVIRFDGCQRGDIVHVRLNFLFFRQDWISHIIEQQTADQEIYFVDQGAKLPFFLAFWHHRHRLVRHPDGGTVIIDAVTFHTPYRLTDFLLYPLLWLQLAYRKPIYRQAFRYV